MKKITFAIIGPETENTLDLEKEILKNGHSCIVFQLKDLEVVFSEKKTSIFFEKRDLLDSVDIFIFRAYNKNFVFAEVLVKELLTNGKTVIDEAIGREMIPSKLNEASQFVFSGLKHPKTYQALSWNSWKRILEKVRFPLIAKPIYGQKGQDITKIESEKEYTSFFKKNPKGYLLQEFFEISHDLRIFVVNKKVLGGIKRHIIKNDFRSNASLGAKIEKVKITPGIERVARKAAEAMKYEIAGVDLIETNNAFYVLEVNSSPQWQAFKKYTKINPAEAIIKYALQKHALLKNRSLNYAKNNHSPAEAKIQ